MLAELHHIITTMSLRPKACCATRLRPAASQNFIRSTYSQATGIILLVELYETNPTKRLCPPRIWFSWKELVNTRCQFKREASPHGRTEFYPEDLLLRYRQYLSAGLHDTNPMMRLRPTASCVTRLRPTPHRLCLKDLLPQ